MVGPRLGDPIARLPPLLEAGIDPSRAMTIAAGDADAATARRLRAVADGLQSGQSLSELLRQQRLLCTREVGPVAALAATGRWDQALAWVAAERAREHGLQRRLRGGLLLPAAVFGIAALVGPLLAVFAGTLPPAQYPLAALRPVALAAAVIWLGFRAAPALWRALRHGRLQLGARPTTGEREWLYHLLAHLLGAGLAGGEALRISARAASGALAARLHRVGQRARSGSAVVPALAAERLLDPRQDEPLLDSAEQAGRLPAMLQRRRDQLREQRTRHEDMIAEWLPRLVYVLAVVTALRYLL